MKTRIASVLAMVFVMGFATAGFSAGTCPMAGKDAKPACAKQIGQCGKKDGKKCTCAKCKDCKKGAKAGCPAPKGSKGTCPKK